MKRFLALGAAAGAALGCLSFLFYCTQASIQVFGEADFRRHYPYSRTPVELLQILGLTLLIWFWMRAACEMHVLHRRPLEATPAQDLFRFLRALWTGILALTAFDWWIAVSRSGPTLAMVKFQICCLFALTLLALGLLLQALSRGRPADWPVFSATLVLLMAVLSLHLGRIDRPAIFPTCSYMILDRGGPEHSYLAYLLRSMMYSAAIGLAASCLTLALARPTPAHCDVPYSQILSTGGAGVLILFLLVLPFVLPEAQARARSDTLPATVHGLGGTEPARTIVWLHRADPSLVIEPFPATVLESDLKGLDSHDDAFVRRSAWDWKAEPSVDQIRALVDRGPGHILEGYDLEQLARSHFAARRRLAGLVVLRDSFQERRWIRLKGNLMLDGKSLSGVRVRLIDVPAGETALQVLDREKRVLMGESQVGLGIPTASQTDAEGRFEIVCTNDDVHFKGPLTYVLAVLLPGAKNVVVENGYGTLTLSEDRDLGTLRLVTRP